MIVTVTLNPALHVRYTAEGVLAGRLNRVSAAAYRAGGSGLAVARLLQAFGHEVIAAGLAGGAAGEMIRSDLAASGVATRFTPIGRETRRVIEVTEGADGPVTGFEEPAPYITTEELGRLASDYRKLLDGATAVVLCGSLPEGLPAETYGTLATYAADAGVPVVLSTSGEALRRAAARRPALVIPEPGEPAAAGPPGPDALLASGAAAVAEISGPGVRVSAGLVRWHAHLDGGPRLPSDAVVAGMVPGTLLGWSWPDMLRHAVALAAAMRPDGEADLTSYESLVHRVRITRTS